MTTYAIKANFSAATPLAAQETQLEQMKAAFVAQVRQGASANQLYDLITKGFGAQADAIEVLGYLLANVAANQCSEKYRSEEVIERVMDIARSALDEIFGLRPMYDHRPDDHQFASLLKQISDARTAAGLPALKVLKKN
jgi:hypothetical protein